MPHPSRIHGRIHLSARTRVRLVAHAPRGTPPVARPSGAPLFGEVEALLGSGRVTVTRDDGAPLEVDELPLAEFHALRAVLTNAGMLEEEPAKVTCRNCDGPITVSPCAALPLGPFVDGELDDPELDATLDLGVAHPIPPIDVGGVTASAVALAPRSRARARGLHDGLRRRTFRVSARLVDGMGVAALGAETDPKAIARALERASPEAWDAVTALFLDAHYPPRLCGVVACAACGARNDVDAPMDREFTPERDREDDARGSTFPDEPAFSAHAAAVADELVGEDVVFVVDAGVPACDDGGEPLLGSYVPRHDGDPTSPSRAAEITVYYRTFRAMFAEEGAYDWQAELRETVQHELEHHAAALAGHDPKDEEERDEIRREAGRVLGKRALAREASTALGADVLQFLRRTWPLWILVGLLTVLAALGER